MTPPDPAPAPRSALDMLGERLEMLTLLVASLAVAGFSALVIYVALARYLFDETPYWSEELPRSLLVWAIFIGLFATTRRGAHLNAGLLPLLVRSPALRHGLTLLAHVMTTIFLAILAVTGWQLTMAGHHSLTTALQVPNSLVYAALPIGAGLACLASFVAIFKRPAP